MNIDERKAWDQGYEAYIEGKSQSDNPYKPSNHERDTTFQDEMHYQWCSGFQEAGEDYYN